VSPEAPFCIAICPAVLPLPYSLVRLDPAGALVSFGVDLPGLTPADGGVLAERASPDAGDVLS
jgi:hypothetical protein